MCNDVRMTTVSQQAERFLADLAVRRRRPAKPATLKAYRSYLDNWIIPQLGPVELGSIENGVMKGFVNHLVEHNLSPATVGGAVTVLKALIGSETDGNGNRLHPRDWNQGYIDAPAVNPDAQKSPVVTQKQLNGALIRASRPYQAFYGLQASTGLRMGEMLALRMGPDTGSGSFLDLEQKVVYVRSAMYDRQEQSTKSTAGVREVDLCQSIVPWLKEKFDGKKQEQRLFETSKGTLWHVASIYRHLERDEIPGTHSLRRFRTTHLENMSVPRVLVDYWTGHAGKAITDRYTKLGQSINARKNWCKRAGLGFQLPGDNDETQIEYLYGDDEQEDEILEPGADSGEESRECTEAI